MPHEEQVASMQEQVCTLEEQVCKLEEQAVKLRFSSGLRDKAKGLQISVVFI